MCTGIKVKLIGAERFKDNSRVTVIHDNFVNIEAILRKLDINGVDGIMADLGVSSHQLDSMNRDEDIDRFALELTDRFGSIPPQAAALLEVVKVRIRAQKIGIERAILKNGQVSFYFVSDQRSAFYQSPVFAAVINWIQSHPRKAQLKQVKDKLIMTIKDVPDIANLRALVDDILASCAAPSTTK